MQYFFYGNFESKIREKISQLVIKGAYSKIEFNLNSETISDIISAVSTENLFGEKNIVVVDITNSEIDDIQNLFTQISNNFEILIYYRDDLEKSSKIFKSLPKNFSALEFKKNKLGNIFSFIDFLLLNDVKKAYLELSNLKENEVLIYNNIVTVVRNLLALKLNLDMKSKILPFKLGIYKKAAERFSNSELITIFNNLYENDCKFKKGEITGEMLLMYSVNMFFIDKNGNSK